MTDFAKIFESDKYGQILVLNDTSDDGSPAVKLSLNCFDEYGIISVDSKFKDTPEGFEQADEMFFKIDLIGAELMAGRIAESLGLIVSEG